MGRPSKYGRSFGLKESNFGSNTNGHVVKAFGNTTNKYFKWNPTTNTLEVVGDLDLSGQEVKGARFSVGFSQFAAADIAKTFFIAPAPCKMVLAQERHVTVAGQAGTMQIEKLTAGQAPGAGVVTLASAFDLTSTTNTPVTKAALTTAAATLAAGDALCLNLASGAATSLALATLSVEMEWL